MSPTTAILDEWLPEYDEVTRHETVVAAAPEAVYEALWRTDFSRSLVVRTLLRLRGMRFTGAAPACVSLGSFERAGFVRLEEHPGREVVLGLAGRFWTPAGHLRRFTPDQFQDFDEPGFARAAWSFALEELEPGVTRLITETRVHCTDSRARRRFRFYWAFVGPFSGFIRRAMLAAVRRNAERAAQPGTETGGRET